VFLNKKALVVSLLLLPLSVAAMQQTTWNFRGGNVDSDWQISGFAAERLEAGLHLTAQKEATMLAPIQLDHDVQIVSATFISARATEGKFLWHDAGTEEGTFTQLPFVVPGGGAAQTIDINTEAYPQWSGRPQIVGFAMPEGADVVLVDMQFKEWNWVERAEEAMVSFWRFDRFTPYSINFVWGPLLTFNPVATAELFTTLPPRGASANTVFYVLMGLAGAAIVAHWFFREGKRNHVALFFLCFAVLWGVYEIRMGLELLSYAKTDFETYLLQPEDTRTFRSYDFLTQFAQDAAEAAKGENTIAVVQRGTPILAMLRYFAYPTVPQEVNGASDVKVWAILDRPDVSLSENWELIVNGQTVTARGKVLHRYDTGSFIFVVE
jgi:hypothetical protein